MKKLITLLLALALVLTCMAMPALATPPDVRQASPEEMLTWPEGAAGKIEVHFTADALKLMDDNAWFTVFAGETDDQSNAATIPVRALMVDNVLTIFVNAAVMEEVTVVYMPYDMGQMPVDGSSEPIRYKLTYMQNNKEETHGWWEDGWDDTGYGNGFALENIKLTLVTGDGTSSPATTTCTCNCTCGGCACNSQ